LIIWLQWCASIQLQQGSTKDKQMHLHWFLYSLHLQIQPSDPQQFSHQIIAFHSCKKLTKIIKAVQLCLEGKFRSATGGSSGVPNAAVHIKYATIYI
jgi:hypothetical protein